MGGRLSFFPSVLKIELLVICNMKWVENNPPLRLVVLVIIVEQRLEKDIRAEDMEDCVIKVWPFFF